MTAFIVNFEAHLGQGTDAEDLYSYLSLISEASGMEGKDLNFSVLLTFFFYCYLGSNARGRFEPSGTNVQIFISRS